jgi:uncharacterized protein (DUF952 family)
VDAGSREENASKQEIGARFCRIRAEQAPRLPRQRLSWRPAAFTVGRQPGHFRGKSQETQRLAVEARKAVRTIYKITPASAWREAERQGVYRGSADDLRDGFIHFSTASQVAETARKHYFGKTGLFLVAVDADALGDALRWEPSRNDELFPHLYGELDLGAVTAILDMRARSDGYHDIPELIP